MHNEDLKDHDCGCDHNHDEGCGCSHDHVQTVTLTLEDGRELECPIIDIFEINGNSYICLLNPENHSALLYGFKDFEDGNIEISRIETDEEFELVTNYVKEHLIGEEE